MGLVNEIHGSYVISNSDVVAVELFQQSGLHISANRLCSSNTSGVMPLGSIHDRLYSRHAHRKVTGSSCCFKRCLVITWHW